MDPTVTQDNAPIYAGLVRERGDVPADARDTAEKTLRMMEQVMDFSAVRARRS